MVSETGSDWPLTAMSRSYQRAAGEARLHSGSAGTRSEVPRDDPKTWELPYCWAGRTVGLKWLGKPSQTALSNYRGVRVSGPVALFAAGAATAFCQTGVRTASALLRADLSTNSEAPLERASNFLGFSVSDGFAQVSWIQRQRAQEAHFGGRRGGFRDHLVRRAAEADTPERRHTCQTGRQGDRRCKGGTARRDRPSRRQWWRRWELNPRPMNSPRRPLRA